MLKIFIPEQEYFDEKHKVFINVKGQSLQLEHSLRSLSKWEEKWKVPYLTTDKTLEQTLDYVRCMTITQNVDNNIYKYIPKNILNEILEYINDSKTATTITRYSGNNNNRKKEIITAEIIYYWMFNCGIPKECEKWHLSKLMTLLEVFSIKNAPNGKKMSKKEITNQNRALNAARRKASGSKG